MTGLGHARVRGRVPSLDKARRVRPGPLRWHPECGASLVELLAVCLLVAIAGGWSLSLATTAEGETRLTGAAHLLANVCAQARAEAVRRGANVAVEFVGDDRDPTLRLVADGNENGVRRSEVDAGTDPEIRSLGRVGDHFRGVRFEVVQACPGIDGAEPAEPGSDPLRFGSAGLLVFTPAGTSSGGTAYLAGSPRAMVAVRVLGATGRVRTLRCSGVTGQWAQP